MARSIAALAERTLRAELDGIVAASADRINEHPFHRGIRDGSLPGAALAHYLVQDSYYVLPSYGRALARCAASIPEHRHAQLLGRMASGALDSAAESARGFGAMAGRLDLPVPAELPAPITPTTLMITSFFAAASAGSPAAAVGALLPSAWLWQLVTDDLLARHDPASRYAETVRTWHPGEEYPAIVAELLALAEDVAEASSARERAELVRNVEHAARYEWMTVDAAWRLESWPY